MNMMKQWTGTLTRKQAIRIIDDATDRDDPFWENVVDDFYDEESDTLPSIYHVFKALGVSREEYRDAVGGTGWLSETKPEKRCLEWRTGIFEIWQDTSGNYVAVNTVMESELAITKEFALDAMSEDDANFIDSMSLLTFM